MRRLLYFQVIGFASLAYAFALRPPAVLSHPVVRTAEHVLHAFQGPSDGSGPVAGVIAGNHGLLYGTTILGGGNSACPGGCGTIFSLTPGKTGYEESILHRFNGTDGSEPQGPLLDVKGSLYGVALIGGGAGYGTVFKLTPHVFGYAFSVLHSFRGAGDGSQPSGGLIADQSGAIYGTTQFYGGAKSGTVFKLTPSKTGYAFSVIYTFQGGNDGAYPLAGLVAGAGGTLFGTTSGGGAAKQGTVFELTPTRSGYAERVVYGFHGGSDGAGPASALLAGANGSLYGTTLGGGRRFMLHICVRDRVRVDARGIRIRRTRPVSLSRRQRRCGAGRGPGRRVRRDLVRHDRAWGRHRPHMPGLSGSVGLRNSLRVDAVRIDLR